MFQSVLFRCIALNGNGKQQRCNRMLCQTKALSTEILLQKSFYASEMFRSLWEKFTIRTHWTVWKNTSWTNVRPMQTDSIEAQLSSFSMGTQAHNIAVVYHSRVVVISRFFWLGPVNVRYHITRRITDWAIFGACMIAMRYTQWARRKRPKMGKNFGKMWMIRCRYVCEMWVSTQRTIWKYLYPVR